MAPPRRVHRSSAPHSARGGRALGPVRPPPRPPRLEEPRTYLRACVYACVRACARPASTLRSADRIHPGRRGRERRERHVCGAGPRLGAGEEGRVLWAGFGRGGVAWSDRWGPPTCQVRETLRAAAPRGEGRGGGFEAAAVPLALLRRQGPDPPRNHTPTPTPCNPLVGRKTGKVTAQCHVLT